jgi:nicotianamine synthase-like protein
MSLVVSQVADLRARLEASDLRPSPEVNATFHELVELCTAPAVHDEALLSRLAEHAAALRTLCATGEFELEREWSTRIARAADPVGELGRFPYLDNYRDLVRLELAALQAVGKGTPSSVAVLGSGPLPLTGLVLAGEHGARVVHVDRDERCLTLDAAVTEAVGLSAGIDRVQADLATPYCADRLRAARVDQAELVVLAALVGSSSEAKRSIVERLVPVLRPDAIVLVRSAHGLRSLLYAPVRREDLAGLRVLLEIHPGTDVVNSVLVAKPMVGV